MINKNRKKRMQEEAKFVLHNDFNNNAVRYLQTLESDLAFLEECNKDFSITAFPTDDTKTKIDYVDAISKPTIVCISGKARSGKDTSTCMLYDELTSRGKTVLICHYADLLKYVCKQFLGWNGEKDNYGRTLLQHVGTEVVRSQDEDFWANFLVKIITFFKGRWDYVLIPDTRFPNEIECWKNNNFKTIHIRVQRDNFDSPLSEEQQKHASEIALDKYKIDYLIKNDSDLESLKYKVLNCCEDYIVKFDK